MLMADDEDLQVKQAPEPVQPEPPPIHEDPAIKRSHYSRPLPTSLSMPSIGTGPVPYMGSHPSQIGLPRSTFQGGVPLYQPGGNMGSWGSSPPPMYWQRFYGHPPMYWQGFYGHPPMYWQGFYAHPPMYWHGFYGHPPMYWQGFYGHPNGLQQTQGQPFLRPPQGMPMYHTMQQPLQQYTGANQSLPTRTSNLPSLNLPPSTVQELLQLLPPVTSGALNSSSTLAPCPGLPPASAPAPALPNATLTSSSPLASPLTTLNLDMNPAPPSLNSNKRKMVPLPSIKSYQTAPSEASYQTVPSALSYQSAPSVAVYQTAPQSNPTIGGPPSSSHTERSSPALVTPGQLLQPGPSMLSTPHSTQPSHKDVEVVQPPSSEQPAPPPSVPEVKSLILPLPTPHDQKDLHVQQAPQPVQPAQPPIHEDPLSIQSHYSCPSPMSLSMPSIGTGPVQDMGSHLSQLRLRRSTFQGGVPLYQPGRNMGSWGSSPPPMCWQGFYGHPNGLQQMQERRLLRPPQGMPMYHAMQQPMPQYTGMNPSLPTRTSNLPSLNLPPSTVQELPPLLPHVTSGALNSSSTLAPGPGLAPTPALPNATLTSSLLLASPLTTSNLDMNPAPPSLNSNKPKMVPAPSMPSYQTASSTQSYQTEPSAPSIQTVPSAPSYQTMPSAPSYLSAPSVAAYQTESQSYPTIGGPPNSSHTETSSPAFVTSGQLLQPGPSMLSTPHSTQPSRNDVEVVQPPSSQQPAPPPSVPEVKSPILPSLMPQDQNLNGVPQHARNKNYHYRGRGRGRGNRTGDTQSAGQESNGKKPGRGGARPSTGRGYATRSDDQGCLQVSSSTTLPSNGQLESYVYKEEVATLRSEMTLKEEELELLVKKAAELDTRIVERNALTMPGLATRRSIPSEETPDGVPMFSTRSSRPPFSPKRFIVARNSHDRRIEAHEETDVDMNVDGAKKLITSIQLWCSAVTGVLNVLTLLVAGGVLHMFDIFRKNPIAAPCIHFLLAFTVLLLPFPLFLARGVRATFSHYDFAEWAEFSLESLDFALVFVEFVLEIDGVDVREDVWGLWVASIFVLAANAIWINSKLCILAWRACGCATSSNSEAMSDLLEPLSSDS